MGIKSDLCLGFKGEVERVQGHGSKNKNVFQGYEYISKLRGGLYFSIFFSCYLHFFVTLLLYPFNLSDPCNLIIVFTHIKVRK